MKQPAASGPVGFIGQGFVGKHMADDFEQRGYAVVRYALEPQYASNRTNLSNCKLIFVAVPTPTTLAEGFDLHIVQEALSNVPEGATAVIKSTIIPGSTNTLQAAYPDITVMHSPEFLREKTAAEDTAYPERNIIGITSDIPELRSRAEMVLSTLPPAPYSLITLSVNAECVKYIGNTYLYTKLLYMNLAFDFALQSGADWEVVRTAVTRDTRIGTSHTQPVNDGGRGAGGHCFIKDFEAFIQAFEVGSSSKESIALLQSMRAKNNQLLSESHKDLDLLRGVYGDDIPIY